MARRKDKLVETMKEEQQEAERIRLIRESAAIFNAPEHFVQRHAHLDVGEFRDKLLRAVTSTLLCRPGQPCAYIPNWDQ